MAEKKEAALKFQIEDLDTVTGELEKLHAKIEQVLNLSDPIGRVGSAVGGTGTVRPLGIRPALLGGGDFFYTPEGTTGQPGTQAWDWLASALVDVQGLNNIGLLVTTWGKVTWAGDDSFVIDDGSGSRFGDLSAPGVRVVVPVGVNIPALDTIVSVTGISSCYRVDDAVYRLLRVRKPADITTLTVH